jgi:hypothetical protein
VSTARRARRQRRGGSARARGGTSRARPRRGGDGGGAGAEAVKAAQRKKNNEGGLYTTLCKCSLLSARDPALSKDFFNLKIYFVECPRSRTRQRRLYRVPLTSTRQREV